MLRTTVPYLRLSRNTSLRSAAPQAGPGNTLGPSPESSNLKDTSTSHKKPRPVSDLLHSPGAHSPDLASCAGCWEQGAKLKEL